MNLLKQHSNYNGRFFKKAFVALLVVFMMVMSSLSFSNSVHAAGESTSFGVEGYTEGSDWKITDAKALRVIADSLETERGGV